MESINSFIVNVIFNINIYDLSNKKDINRLLKVLFSTV